MSSRLQLGAGGIERCGVRTHAIEVFAARDQASISVIGQLGPQRFAALDLGLDLCGVAGRVLHDPVPLRQPSRAADDVSQ
jgi:hypothetical protein